MSDRLSPEREAEIAARAEAAHPGPWRRSEEGIERCVLSEDDIFAISFEYRGNNTQAEADFVANAREDVPALLTELAAVRAERDQAAARVAELETELARAKQPSYSSRHVWTVWREDQPVHAHYATEDDARQGSIDCWEEDEPHCPDYSWKPDGPRLELLVGGEASGVYISRADVFGTPGPALPWAHVMSDDDLHGFLGDLVSAAIGRWQHSPEVPDRTVLAAVEKACADWRTPGQGLRSDEPKAGESS